MAKINAFTGEEFHWGSRIAIAFLLLAIRKIQEHRQSLAVDVPSEINEAINGLLFVAELLRNMNPPGPR